MTNDFFTVIVAAMPVLELRGALPLALLGFKMEPLRAYFLSVFGNFLPVIPLLLFWHHIIHRLAARFYFVRRCKEWWFLRIESKHKKSFEILKEVALFVFVAIPLPLTGAWSGTVAAYVFGIPFWRAVIVIGLGIAAAGLVVLTASGLFLQ